MTKKKKTNASVVKRTFYDDRNNCIIPFFFFCICENILEASFLGGGGIPQKSECRGSLFVRNTASKKQNIASDRRERATIGKHTDDRLLEGKAIVVYL